MKVKNILTMLFIGMQFSYGQVIFKTEKTTLEIKSNKNTIAWNLTSNNEQEVEIAKKKAKITLSDGKKSIVVPLEIGKTTTVSVVNTKNDTIDLRLNAVAKNVTFSKKYVREHQGKNFVQIPEVSELVNVLMALHKDAEKEHNMFDTQNAYYERIKKHFAPYRNHPALDTIQKYITTPQLNEQVNELIFPMESYIYYYALKMNACAYQFDTKGNIVNQGNIQQISKGWSPFDPMKDAEIFADFARKSNFRQFYKDNESYYQTLISDYNRLNPIQKMQNWLDTKFGFGYGSYVVYFSPLIAGAHSTMRFEDNGLSQTFMFIRKSDFDENFSLMHNEMQNGRIVFTEIDHNYVNPLSDKYLDAINEVFADSEKWAKNESSKAYDTPYRVFNEYMTFAVYSLFLWDNYPAEAVQEYLPEMENLMEIGRGFGLFKAFNRTLLQKYQENPNIPMEDLYLYILEECKSKI